MYPEMIAEADEIFTEILRIRADSVELRTQANALLHRYRAHRFPRVCGASESGIDPSRAATILSKIHSGALPRPAETPEKC
jgi:NADH pyrophosphatase NudC (nudix superfamily)